MKNSHLAAEHEGFATEGSISLELHSAPIDSQGQQFITGFCILMGSYFTRTAWRSMVMTDRSRLPLLDRSGTSRAVNSATVRRNPWVICLSSDIVLPQIFCAQNITSLILVTIKYCFSIYILLFLLC